MKRGDLKSVKKERAAEHNRQVREAFDQRKDQDSRWFFLRLRMGYMAGLFLPAIFIFCCSVLYCHKNFPDFVVKTASAALFGDVLGMVIFVWKLVLKSSSNGVGPH